MTEELTNIALVKQTLEDWKNYLKDNWDKKPSNYAEKREAYQIDLRVAISKDIFEWYEEEDGFMLRPVTETGYKIAGINQGWDGCEADYIKVNGEWVEDVEANFMKDDVIMRMGNGVCFNDGEYPDWYAKEHTEYEDGPMTMYEVSLEF